MWEVGSCCDLMPELGRIFSVYAAGMAGREDSGGIHHDPTPGDARPTEDGKRRLIRVEGFVSRVSGTVQPQDPGGGATPVAAP